MNLIPNRRACATLLFLLLFSLTPLCLEEPARQGKILSLGEGAAGATAVIKVLPASSPVNLGKDVSVTRAAGQEDLGGGGIQIRPGLRVHLVVQFGGAVLRPPIGMVTKVLDAERCEARLDSELLDRTVQDPRDGSTHLVRSLLVPGAEVSLAED